MRRWTRLAAILVVPAGFSSAHAQIEARWLSPVNGFWHTPSRWSTGAPPQNAGGSLYHAIIDAQGAPYWVDFYGPNTTLSRFTLNSAAATFYHNTNTIQILDRMDVLSGSYRFELNRGSGDIAMIRGGLLNIAPTASFIVTGRGGSGYTAGILDGVQVNGLIDLPMTNSWLEIRNGLQLNGTLRLAGQNSRLYVQGTQTIVGGTIFGDSASSSWIEAPGNTVLTLSPSTVVRGGQLSMWAGGIGGPQGLLRNLGRISGDVSGAGIEIGGTRFENAGIVEAMNGGSVAIARSSGSTISETTWTNTGTFRIGPDSRLTLGGRFSTADIGTIERSGGQLVLSGELNNQGATLALNTAGGTWRADRGVIRGGTVVTSPGAELQVQALPIGSHEFGLTLDGVHLEGGLNLTDAGQRVLLPNGLSFDGTVRVAGSFTSLFVGGQSVLSGPEILLGSGSLTGGISLLNNAAVTITGGTVIRGAGGVGGIELYPSSLRNRGLLVADNPLNPLVFQPRGPLVNEGTIRADSSRAHLGSVYLQSLDSFTNLGRVEAVNGGWVYIETSTPTNLANGVLTGGTWLVEGFGSESKITFRGAPAITRNEADIILRGPQSAFPSLNSLNYNAGTLLLEERNFSTAGILANSGLIEIGEGSALVINGAYAQLASGELTLALATNNWARVTSTAHASLAGSLTISAADPMSFSLGQAFEILQYPTRGGTFGSVHLPMLGNGLWLELAYSITAVTVHVVPAPSALAVLLITGGMCRRRRGLPRH